MKNATSVVPRKALTISCSSAALPSLSSMRLCVPLIWIDPLKGFQIWWGLVTFLHQKSKGSGIQGGSIICWTIWKTKNSACFDRKFPDDPSAVIFKLCSLLKSWNILQKTEDRNAIEEGVLKIKEVSREVFSTRHGQNPLARRIHNWCGSGYWKWCDTKFPLSAVISRFPRMFLFCPLLGVASWLCLRAVAAVVSISSSCWLALAGECASLLLGPIVVFCVWVSLLCLQTL